jgi:hypothetical protein
MTHEEVTRWSAIEHQGHLRYGQPIMMECLFGIIDGRTVDEFGFDLERHKEIERAKAWQEHNAVAARYAMKELFALIDMRAAELAPVFYLEAAE